MEFLKLVRTQWDRTGAIVAVALGALCLLLGWIGVSGTEHVAAQLPYIVSGGLVGIFLLGIGAVLWISADLRDEWRELRRLGRMVQQEQDERRRARDGRTVSNSVGTEDTRPVLRRPETGRTRTAGA